MKKIYILAILFVLVGRMFAINYPTYNPDHLDRSGGTVYRTSTVGYGTSQIGTSASCLSAERTMTTMGFGAISAVPTIGSNGCASAPHRTSMGGDDDDDDDNDDNGGFVPTPITPQTPDNQVPVGDCVFPLLFAALLFAIGKKFSKKSAESTKFC